MNNRNMPVMVKPMKWRSSHPSNRRTTPLSMGRPSRREPAFLHRQVPGRAIEIALVVSDGDHGLAALVQGGEDLVVELSAERRILVRRELVEHVDRPVLQGGDNER